MNFIVALSCEAKPIIDELRLTKQLSPTPFPVFRSDFHQLVISGIGKVAAAAATITAAARVAVPPAAVRRRHPSRARRAAAAVAEAAAAAPPPPLAHHSIFMQSYEN